MAARRYLSSMLSKRSDFKSAYGRAECYLSNAIQSGRIPHALIIAGPKGSGREELARFICKKLLKCESDKSLDAHPDYLEFDCVQKSKDIDRLHALLEELRQRPFGGGFRTVLFRESQHLREQYQNVLLKTLEEPPANTVFIFEGNETGLLPTIRSRSAVIRIGVRDGQELKAMLLNAGATREEAEFYARVSGGIPGSALSLYSDDEKRKLRNIALDCAEAALSRKLDFSLGNAIEQTAPDTEDKGRANAQFALDRLLSFFRDMLLLKSGFEIEENIDRTSSLHPLAARFTSGGINCIIDLLLEAKIRIAHNANPERTLDRLMIDISEVL